MTMCILKSGLKIMFQFAADMQQINWQVRFEETYFSDKRQGIQELADPKNARTLERLALEAKEENESDVVKQVMGQAMEEVS